MSPRQLAERWSVQCKTLANWRTAGTGPTFVKVGGLVRYALLDIETYEAANRVEAVA